jgi:hypothetical protein
LLFALGIHGRYLFVDRRNQVVIVMMSSQANPLDAELISLTMTAVSHFREIFAPLNRRPRRLLYDCGPPRMGVFGYQPGRDLANEADRIRIIFAGSRI